ncbi:MFS transporter [Chromatiales bacterium (ex Bugula neritina AB1)]|nr:MFS transporter [Chromatiales bacterium (ex Bugula neritina AB1)]
MELVGKLQKSQPGQLEFVALMSLITSLTAVSIDALLPALKGMGEALAVASMLDIQLIVSVFIAGMVFGELFFGPLSDAIGRKNTIVAGLIVYCIGAIVAMSAQSLELMLAGRAIQGIGVSGPKIASRALVRDIYRGDEMARIMSLVLMVFILVPMLAPLLGQLVISYFSWRAIFVVYLIMAMISGAWLCARQRETLPPSSRISLRPLVFYRNAQKIVRHSSVMVYTVVAGAVLGSQLLYLSVVPTLFFDVYGVTHQFPLYFAILALGVGGAAYSNSKLVQRYGMQAMALTSIKVMTAIAFLLFVICLLTGGKPSLLCFMICGVGLMACIGILFGNLNALAMQYLGRLAGTGASIVASISSAVAVIIAVLLGRYYDGTVYVIAVGYLLCGGIGLLLLRAAPRMNSVAV